MTPNDAVTTDAATLDLLPSTMAEPTIPGYLRDTYHWAYLNGFAYWLFDRPSAVNTILFGNMTRLIRTAVEEIEPGSRVLQTACVYGSMSVDLARKIGSAGSLEVIDVAPIQVEGCRRKLADFPFAHVRRADAAKMGEGGAYDAVVCFFLLHEVPNEVKRQVVANVLGNVRPGGKAVFVDYHRARPWHPLRPLMRLVFDWLEPFARDLCATDIPALADWPEGFAWHMEDYFGGLYQKVVARRLS